MNALTVSVLLILCLAAILLCYNAWIALPREMRAIYKQGLAAFAKAIEARSGGLYGSTQQVVLLSLAIAKELNFSSKEINRLEFAAYLRDIGLSAVPYRVIHNTSNRSEYDQCTFDRHADTGAAMLEQLPYFRSIAPIVRHHHAPWTEHLKRAKDRRNRLPVESKVLAVVSFYFEQVTLYGHDTAIHEIRMNSGTKFDPAVVKAIEKVLTTINEPNYWEMLRSSVAAL